jgi:hypothetical protein
VELEHTQNKAQFGRRVRAAPGNLTASGIFYSEIGHWVVWFTRNSFGIKFGAIFFRRGLIHEILLRLLLGTVICLSVTTLRAQDDDKPKDAEGCKDAPLVTRISQCPSHVELVKQ